MSESTLLVSKESTGSPLKMPSLVLSAVQRKFVTGVVLLLCVVVLWTASSFITSDLLGGGFDKPFLITYLNTASFTFYLIPFAWKRWKRRHQSTSHAYKPLHEQAPVEDALAAHSPPAPARTILPRRSTSLIRTLSPSPALVLHHPSPSTTSQPLSPLHTTSDLPRRRSSSLSRHRPRTLSLSNSRATPARYNGDGDDHLAPLTTEETAKLAAVFCLAWMAANWSLNASLGLTSVGSSTILAGMSGFFTLGLGRLVGVETLTRSKVLAVFASFVGLLLVTHSDSLISTTSTTSPSDMSSTVPPPSSPRLPRNPLLGDMLALLSAFCYALYVILLKVRIGQEERVNMQLFFGFVGLFNTILLLPLIPILDVLSIENFQLPTRRQDWLVCAVNMMITLSSDYLYVLAMLKTTPVVVTVGLSLTIPLAMLGDLVRGSTSSITVQSLGGAALVLVGFGLMGHEGLEEKIEEVETEAETERAEVDVVVFDAEDADREYRGT